MSAIFAIEIEGIDIAGPAASMERWQWVNGQTTGDNCKFVSHACLDHAIGLIRDCALG